MTEALAIILPLPAKVLSPNCHTGWAVKAAAAKRYRRLAREAIEAEQVESMPWPRVAVQATFFHATKRRRDQDNAMASLKAAYDGIVDSGLVCDDDYEHMSRESPTFIIDREYPRIELSITRLEE